MRRWSERAGGRAVKRERGRGRGTVRTDSCGGAEGGWSKVISARRSVGPDRLHLANLVSLSVEHIDIYSGRQCIGVRVRRRNEQETSKVPLVCTTQLLVLLRINPYTIDYCSVVLTLHNAF